MGVALPSTTALYAPSRKQHVVLRNRKVAGVLSHTAPELPTNGGGAPTFRKWDNGSKRPHPHCGRNIQSRAAGNGGGKERKRQADAEEKHARMTRKNLEKIQQMMTRLRTGIVEMLPFRMAMMIREEFD
ncbi:Hypothetical protein PHPALM_6053, partial [Phytophthora palmivora]